MRAMIRSEVPKDVRHQIVNNLSSCLDFRRLRAGDTFTVDLDGEGELLRCLYESDPCTVTRLSSVTTPLSPPVTKFPLR